MLHEVSRITFTLWMIKINVYNAENNYTSVHAARWNIIIVI